MQKFLTFLIFASLLILGACTSSKEKTENATAETPGSGERFFPVTDFLKGQLRLLDSMPVTPLKIVTINGKTDSTWLKRESIRLFATPFLIPEIDSATMSPYFSMSSFLDQTINAITFSYDVKTKLPDSIKLRHWDVYIDPQTGTVQRIYLVKENGINTTLQLTWKTDEGCTIRTITQKPGSDAAMTEEKMIWAFDK